MRHVRAEHAARTTTATRTKQICIFDNVKQCFSTLLTREVTFSDEVLAAVLFEVLTTTRARRSKSFIREFKKLRRQLQRKRDIKIELCIKLSLLRLLHVGHVVQNRRTALSLAWHEWFSCKGKE